MGDAKHSRFLTLVALVLCWAPLLRADGLSDLRLALGRLKGHEAISVSVELNLWKRRKDGGEPVITQGEGRVTAEDGPAGIALRFSPQLLPQVDQESLEKMKTADIPTPKNDCMDELGARRIWEYLGYSDAVLRELEQCKLTGEELGTRDGRSVRVLHLTVNPSIPTSIKKLLDKLETHVSVWTELDGTPLYAEIHYTYKGSRFFIGFSGTHDEILDFRIQGHRLVVVKHDWKETYEGFGVASEVHKVYTLSVN